VVLYVLAGTHQGTVSTHTCSVQRFTPWILRVPRADCEYSVTLGSRAASSRRGASYALGARGTRGTVSTCTRSLSTARVCRVPSLPRTSSARGTVGLPREATHPEAGAGPHVARHPDRYPARHGARHGTRSTRMRRRRTRSGAGGRAGAVSRRTASAPHGSAAQA
jgi:hypothetical protein